MSNVITSITMSLDGFIAGVNDTPVQPLGKINENLHNWILEGDHPSKHNDFFKLSKNNREIFDELFDSTGAILTGRRTYDIVHGWQGSYPVRGIPVFVLTHKPPSKVPNGETVFTFVTGEIERAVEQAKAAAADKNVQVIGGAQTIQQCINCGLCDEVRVHLVPQFIGGGKRLFEKIDTKRIRFEQKQVTPTDEVTHLHYKLVSMQ